MRNRKTVSLPTGRRNHRESTIKSGFFPACSFCSVAQTFIVLPSFLIFSLFLIGAAVAQDHAGHAGHGSPQPAPPAAAQQSQAITISPEKLQLIGVRTAAVASRSLDKSIRTVGKVEPDETRLAFVNTKVGGWVKKLFVSFTGEQVSKGQPLFSIYSPDLVTAQEEYLLALRSVRSSQSGTTGFAEIDASRKELLESARRRLLLWDITPQQVEELENTGKPLTDMTIEAPLGGIVLEKMVLEGAYITPGMNLYRIADLSHLWILADVYEYEVPLVKNGQQARITLPYSAGSTLHGKVSYVYPVLDPATRTLKVRIAVKNEGMLLKPEMFANVEILVSSGTRLTIPTEAVLNSGVRQIVYVEKRPGTYEMRDVTLGLRGENYVEVLGGLTKGEKVVTSGNFLIDSESQLRSGGQ
jgi:membrane fusion protein, copper/silver efflux system